VYKEGLLYHMTIKDLSLQLPLEDL